MMTKLTAHDIKFHKGLISDINKCSLLDSTYIQLNYNIETHEAWGDWFCSIGHCDHMQYNDSNVITIGDYSGKTTRKWLTSDINEVLAWKAYYDDLVWAYYDDLV